MGPTMSPRTVTLPRSELDSGMRAGTTRATGRPRLVTTSGSPVSATRSSRARHRALTALNADAAIDLVELDMARS